MSRRSALPLLAASALLVATPLAAMADEGVKFGELLKRGYEVKTTNLLPEEVAKRVGGADWKDGVMLVLQKGDSVAFCHFTLRGTINPDGMLANNCFLAK